MQGVSLCWLSFLHGNRWMSHPIPLGDAGVGGRETDGNGGEKGPDPPEWQKL